MIPAAVAAALSELSRWALVVAISALGMKTALGELASVGAKAMSLLVLETVFIGGIGLTVITFF